MYLNKAGFIKIDAPILTPTSCEETTQLFELDYFGEKAYLSQSGQLYLEAAIFAHQKVFDFGPTFRAEKSKTRRHLTEFWMMDAEMAFCEHQENMHQQEELVCYIVEKVLAENKQELEILERDLAPLKKIKAPFYHIDYQDACPNLNTVFGADEELKLANSYDKPVFVEKYPAKVKAFYMKRDPQDPEKALCDDLLAPGIGEIIGGSQREDDYQTLVQRLEEFKLPRQPFAWYLDLRKYGSVPHSGFGLGLERTVQWLCGLKHIRETIPFPRLLNRLSP